MSQNQSGHNTSSSLSSGGTLSSMETLPTQDVVDGDFDYDEAEEEDETTKIWGRLYPLGKGFEPLDLSKDEYLFGRDSSCDFSFDTKDLRKNSHFQALSKIHFRLYKEDGHVFIQDKSSNGTFINGDKIGKNKKQALANNDEIALAIKKNRAFVYMDNEGDQQNLPQDMKQKYTLSKLLGRGACGEVRLAFKKGTTKCEKFAVKIIQKKVFSIGGSVRKDNSNTVKEEVNILKELDHPCIISIEDVFETDDVLYIILELVEGGELFDRVVNSGKIDESTAKLMFYQMLVSTKYLHDRRITHRDLKPENVLLASDAHEPLIKITDFGLSKFVGEHSLMKTLCGTPTYLAPEVLTTAGMGGYDKTVDCWSLGVILFVMLGGYPPFSDEIKGMKLHDQVLNGHYSFPVQFWRNVSHDGIDLIKKLMTVDPKQRFTTTQALNHIWLKDEIMIKKAHKLMYPEADPKTNPKNESMMPPPAAPVCVAKKRHHPSTDSTDSEDSVSSTKRPSMDDDNEKTLNNTVFV
ncbi:serine/threonine-protein kinase Chk2-like [Saccoglossus kowalevskii]|uniref:Serine/threonine-protein kinase Chk2-like n=1 Tax=Saccoglossus kowalevskii TaxID=10224 RepID=A0ABM0GXD2_SACKO|nr:PREDICTED: serine/threonine-protein kinase Chk2-like [Saccoglossus kowalevskii]